MKKDGEEEEKNFVCNVCSRVFGQKYKLKFHIENQHQKGGKNYKCDYCGKSITDSGYLKKHIKTIHE